MTLPNPAWRTGAAILGVALCTAAPWAQSGSAPVAPLRTTPTERITVKVPFRDWGRTTLTGTTILGGNSSNRGGLYAVDTLSGKVRWSFRPAGTAHGNPFVTSAPAVSGDSVIVPMGNTLMAVSLATGKELWRGPATAQGATVAVGDGIAFVLGEDGVFRALDAASGREKWKMPFTRDSCQSGPVVREGTVYVGGNILVKPADSNSPASYYRHLFALDASTGKERWRSPAAPLPRRSACLRHPVVTADTYFAVSAEALHAVTLANGRDRWAPVETRRMMDGRLRPVEVVALVDAGSTLVGLTKTALMAFDKTSGATAWEVPGQYHPSSPSMAVAGRVLYVQGHPGAAPADEVQGRIVYSGGKPVPSAPALPPGTLRGLDLDTREVLWSFSRSTEEANWPFGFVTPVDGGLWVDSYQALVKLQ